LNITGGITENATIVHQIYFTVGLGGNINVTTNALGLGTGVTWNGVDKYGPGTLTIQVPVANIVTSNLNVYDGTLVLSGVGKLGNGAADAVQVYDGTTASTGVVSPSTLVLDNNAAGYLTNRLSGNNLTLFGGAFNYVVNSTTASTETAGVLTIGTGGSSITFSNSNSATNVLTFTSLTDSANGGTINFNLGTSTDEILFTSAPALTPTGNTGTGILPRSTVTSGSNFNFATYNLTTGITAFTAYNQSTTTDVNAALPTDTLELSNSNFTLSTTLTGSKTLNALAFNGSGLTMSGAVGTTLTLTTGGVLVTGATTADTLSVPVLAFAGVEGIFQINAGSTLNVSSAITGTAGVTFASPNSVSTIGGVALNAPEYNTGSVTVNGGKLTLGGGNNTLNYLPTNALILNGGIVELAGNSQTVGLLESGANLSEGGNYDTGSGGIIQNSSATQSTFAIGTQSTLNFGGQINGNIYFSKGGTGQIELTNVSNYTGGTWLTGGSNL
jgi:hypothetical protein